MKKVLGMYSICVLLAFIWLFSLKVEDLPTETKKVEFEPLNAQMMMDLIVKETKDEKQDNNELTFEDAQNLMQIAMAEAESDGVEGKAMVMAVVLNRVKDQRFPNTIEEVIFQKHQFSPVSDGRFYTVKPDTECHLALAEIEKGTYSHIDALYFENAENSWQSKECEYLYTIGHHRFYKN